MGNSKLVDYKKISKNSNPRNTTIKKITIHHTAGVLSVETLGNIFQPGGRQASSNYGIGSDGRVGMYVEEKNRAWTSGSPANDHQAVTIEVSNSKNGGNWSVSDLVLKKLIELCVDICKRNNIKELIYTGDAKGNLTRHNMFANTACPGPYLQGKFPYIVEEVNKQLNPAPVVVTPTTTYKVVRGDTLGAIAKKFGTTVNELAKLNGIKNVNLIIVGQVLKLPSKTMVVETPKTPATYTVVKGDSLWKIGKKFGIKWQDIAKLNNIKIPYIIHIGQKLKLK